MRTPCIVIVACLSICFALSDSWARSDTEEMAISAAQAWSILVDSADYSGSWKEASAYFRGTVTPENWKNSMEVFRRPLGQSDQPRSDAGRGIGQSPWCTGRKVCRRALHFVIREETIRCRDGDIHVGQRWKVESSQVLYQVILLTRNNPFTSVSPGILC